MATEIDPNSPWAKYATQPSPAAQLTPRPSLDVNQAAIDSGMVAPELPAATTMRPTTASTAMSPVVGFNRGLANVVGAVPDVVSYAMRKTLPEGYAPKSSADTVMGSDWLKHLMRVDTPEAQPRSTMENILQSAGSAVPQALSVPLAAKGLAATAVPAAISRVSPTTAGVVETLGQGAPATVGQTATQAGGAFGGGLLGTTAETFSPEPLKPYANLLGNLVGGTSVNVGSHLLGSRFSYDPSSVAASAERLGVTLPNAAVNPSQLVQRMGQTLKIVPWAGEPLSQASARSLDELQGSANRLVSSLGSGTVEQGGQAARTALIDWMGPRTQNATAAMYNAVDNAITNPNATTPLLNANRMARTLQQEYDAQGLYNSPIPAVRFIETALSAPGGLTYEGIKGLRSRVGELLKNPQAMTSQGIQEGELKRMYGALTDDLGQAAENAGGLAARQAWNEANAFTRQIKATNARLAKLMGGSNVDPDRVPAEAVFNRLLTAASSTKGADLRLLRTAKSIVPPDQWDEFLSGTISQMGRTARNEFSPDSFATSLNKMPAAGRDIMFGPTGSPTRDAIEDIVNVARLSRKLESFGNPSGTAQNLTMAGSGAGLVYSPIKVLAGLVGARSLSQYLSNPVSARQISNWSRSYQEALTNSRGDPETLRRMMINPTASLMAANPDEEARQARQAEDQARGRAEGGRAGYRSGGRILDHAAQADALVRAAEAAKKRISQTTEPLLEMPDEAVVKALSVANENI